MRWNMARNAEQVRAEDNKKNTGKSYCKNSKSPKIASGRKKMNDQTVNGKTKKAEWMPGVEDIY